MHTPSRHSNDGDDKDHSHSGVGYNDGSVGCHGDPVGIHGCHSTASCHAHHSDGKSMVAARTLSTGHSRMDDFAPPRNRSDGHFGRHTGRAVHHGRQYCGRGARQAATLAL